MIIFSFRAYSCILREFNLAMNTADVVLHEANVVLHGAAHRSDRTLDGEAFFLSALSVLEHEGAIQCWCRCVHVGRGVGVVAYYALLMLLLMSAVIR